MFTQILSLPLALATLLLLPGGWLGVELDDERPLAVKSVAKGSPAAKAGIQAGDVFVAVNGRRVRTAEALIDMFDGFEANQKIKLTMRRGERELELEVTLAQRPGEERPQAPQPAGKPYIGIDIDMAEGGGLYVAEVRADGPAATAGLRKGDVITSLNGQGIRNFEDLDKILGDLRPGSKLALTVRRGDDVMRKQLVLGAFPREVARQPERRQPERRRPERRQPERRRPQRPRPVDEGGFSSDYQGALADARRSGKPVVLVFGASWCEDCHTLRKSFEHASLKEPLAEFVCIWLDTDKEGRLADKHNVQGLPHLEILDSTGKCLKKVVGHQTPEALRGLLGKDRSDRRPDLPDLPDRRPGTANVQQLQGEVSRLRQQLQQLQREQAQLRRQLQDIQRRLRDR